MRSLMGILAALLVFALSGCGQNHSSTTSGEEHIDRNIRNGDLVTGFYDYEYVVKLNRNGAFNCTAVQISSKTLITAAHCVAGAALQSLSVRFKNYFSDNSINLYAIHNHYDPATEIGVDLAVLRMNGKKPSNLGQLYGSDVPIGSLATAVGYGVTGNSSDSNSLRTGSVIVNSYFGLNLPFNQGVLSNGYIRTLPADGKNQLACPGDSGGPLVYQNKIAGIFSFLTSFVEPDPNDSNKVCREAVDNFYINLRPHVASIQSFITQYDPPGSCNLDDPYFSTTSQGCRDLRTNRTWSAMVGNMTYRSSASSYCNNLVEGGASDWRLPTRSELQTMLSNGGNASTTSNCWYAWTSSSSTYTVNYMNQWIKRPPSTALRSVICVR